MKKLIIQDTHVQRVKPSADKGKKIPLKCVVDQSNPNESCSSSKASASTSKDKAASLVSSNMNPQLAMYISVSSSSVPFRSCIDI